MSATSHIRGIKEIVTEIRNRVLALTLVELVPQAAVYVGIKFDVPVTQGTTYLYVAGVNETNCDNGGVAVPSGSRFVAAGAKVTFTGGPPAALVTGSVKAVAFDRVEWFDSEDVTAAFQFLLLTEEKVCVIVPLDAKFESVFDSLKLTSKRHVPVAVLCSDRILSDRKAALWGSDTDATMPGAMALAELVLPQVMGLLLANPNGVVGELEDYAPMVVKDTEQAQPGRVVVAVNVNCRGGYLEASLGRSPVM
jgi:hypothetical protein